MLLEAVHLDLDVPVVECGRETVTNTSSRSLHLAAQSLRDKIVRLPLGIGA